MKPLLIVLFSFFSITAFAQNESDRQDVMAVDTIRMYKSFWGTKYYQGIWMPLTYRGIQRLVNENDEAWRYMSGARAKHGFATALKLCGGFVLGWQTFSLVYNEEASPIMFAIGGALTGTSILLDMSAKGKVKKAVRLYNNEVLHRQASSVNPALKIGFTGNGVGLALNF